MEGSVDLTQSGDPEKHKDLEIRDQWLECMGFSNGYHHGTSNAKQNQTYVSE